MNDDEQRKAAQRGMVIGSTWWGREYRTPVGRTDAATLRVDKLSGIITDLMHYATQEGIDFRAVIEEAHKRYEQETTTETYMESWR